MSQEVHEQKTTGKPFAELTLECMHRMERIVERQTTAIEALVKVYSAEVEENKPVREFAMAMQDQAKAFISLMNEKAEQEIRHNQEQHEANMKFDLNAFAAGLTQPPSEFKITADLKDYKDALEAEAEADPDPENDPVVFSTNTDTHAPEQVNPDEADAPDPKPQVQVKAADPFGRSKAVTRDQKAPPATE